MTINRSKTCIAHNLIMRNAINHNRNVHNLPTCQGMGTFLGFVVQLFLKHPLNFPKFFSFKKINLYNITDSTVTVNNFIHK